MLPKLSNKIKKQIRDYALPHKDYQVARKFGVPIVQIRAIMNSKHIRKLHKNQKV